MVVAGGAEDVVDEAGGGGGGGAVGVGVVVGPDVSGAGGGVFEAGGGNLMVGSFNVRVRPPVGVFEAGGGILMVGSFNVRVRPPVGPDSLIVISALTGTVSARLTSRMASPLVGIANDDVKRSEVKIRQRSNLIATIG